MDLSGKKVALIGLGKTGLAVAHFLAGRGARITLTDEKPPIRLGGLPRRDQGIFMPTRPAFPMAPKSSRAPNWLSPHRGSIRQIPILVEAVRRGDPGDQRNRACLAIPEDPDGRHHRDERQDNRHDPDRGNPPLGGAKGFCRREHRDPP